MSYIFFSLLAAFFFALGTLINKFASKHSIKDWKKLWVYFMISYSPIPIFVTPFFAQITWPQEAILEIILNSLFFLIGGALFFISLLEIDASVAAPLYQIQGAAIGILAFLFLGERFPTSSYVWLTIILIGSVLVSLNEKMRLNSFFTRGVLIMISANLFFAFSNLFVGLGLKTQTSWNLLFWAPIVNLIGVGIFITMLKPKLSISFNAIKPMIIAGIVQFFGVISLLAAFQQNITISAVLSLLSAPIVFLVAVIFSKLSPKLLEHHSAKVYAIRAIGLVIILFAAIKLSLG